MQIEQKRVSVHLLRSLLCTANFIELGSVSSSLGQAGHYCYHICTLKLSINSHDPVPGSKVFGKGNI